MFFSFAYSDCCMMVFIHFFESGLKFYFLAMEKKFTSQPNNNKKRPQSSHALGNVTFIVPLPLVCKPLVEFYFTHFNTTNAEMPYEKTKHLGAIVFFFFSIDINILYIILHMRLNYILLPVLCYVKWQLFQSCVLL